MNELSFEDLAERVAEEMRAEKAREWRKNPKWLTIKGISREDLQNGSALIEKLAYPPWDKRNSGVKQGNSLKVGFGKFAHLTLEELKEQQPRYWDWCLENVRGFKERAKNL